jgi:hypothetical protein
MCVLTHCQWHSVSLSLQPQQNVTNAQFVNCSLSEITFKMTPIYTSAFFPADPSSQCFLTDGPRQHVINLQWRMNCKASYTRNHSSLCANSSDMLATSGAAISSTRTSVFLIYLLIFFIIFTLVHRFRNLTLVPKLHVIRYDLRFSWRWVRKWLSSVL